MPKNSNSSVTREHKDSVEIVHSDHSSSSSSESDSESVLSIESQSKIISSASVLFDKSDHDKLCEDQYGRFVDSSKTVGHALIFKNDEGQLLAKQFNAPGKLNDRTPDVVELDEIRIVKKYGVNHALAKAPDGTEMVSLRSVPIKTSYMQHEEEGRLYFFSPKLSHMWKGNIWWGGDETKQPDVFRKDLPKGLQRDLDNELAEIKQVIKRSKIEIVNSDVLIRDTMKRVPDQNTVMGQSALEAYKDFIEQHEGELNQEAKEILQKSVDADPFLRSRGIKSQPRPEWNHLTSFRATPVHQNPQVKDNLGAAPKSINNEMVVLEKPVDHHARIDPACKMSIDTEFQMILDSELVREGTMKATFEKEGAKVELNKHLNPLCKFPNYVKTTDISQVTLAVNHQLNHVPPLKITPVLTDESTTQSFGTTNKQREISMTNDAEIKTKKSNAPLKFEKAYAPAPDKSALINPTSMPHEKSVVLINVSSHSYDYSTPWKGGEPETWKGSGFVFERDGKLYIMSNAHVLSNTTHVTVRLSNHDVEFPAKVLLVAHQTDIGILEVDDPDFKALVEPVEFGEMTSLRQEISVIGFPMGGDEVSISKGIVSRIQVDDYAESGERFLQVQTDSAINPGNSGGPVFSDGKVVGVAFQIVHGKAGLGYFIPMVQINHVLDDYFSPGGYKGFPSLSFGFQELKSRYMHEAMGLEKNQTGVLITTIDPLCDSFNKLKKDDILTEIDGLKISNDGKAHVPGIGSRIDLTFLFDRKQIGETVQLKVLRKDPETQKLVPVTFDVTLKYRAGETKLIGETEHEREPTYLVVSGLLFQPVTPNYLETPEGRPLREMISEKFGYLTDMPKERPGQQLIILNRVFDSLYSEGISDEGNCFIRKANGMLVDNMKDLLKAVQSKTSGHHEFETWLGDKIYVPVLPKKVHKEILEKYHVQKDRSKDLKGLTFTDIPAPLAVQEKEENEDRKIRESEIQSKARESAIKFLTSKGIPLNLIKGLLNESPAPDSEEEEACESIEDTESRSEDELSDASYHKDGFVVEDDPELWEPLKEPVVFSGKNGLGHTARALNELVSKVSELVPAVKEEKSASKKRRCVVEDSDDSSEEEAPKRRRSSRD